MLDQGIHDGIGATEYHEDRLTEQPSLSRSGIHMILSGEPMSVFAANHPRLRDPQWPELKREATKATDIGEVAHRLVLGVGCEFEVKDAWDFTNKDGSPSKTWGSADAAKFKADCDARGVPIISHEKYAMVLQLAEKLTAALEDRFGKDEWAGRKVEQVVLWRRVLDDHCDSAPECDHYAKCWIWCRALIDALLPSGIAVDLKSTELSLTDAELGKATALKGYDLQSEFYKDGLRANGIDCQSFQFAWAQSVPPLGITFYDLAKVGWDLSATRMAIDLAVHRFAACVLSGKFPSYPLEAKPICPSWFAERRGLMLMDAGLLAEEES